MGVTGARPFRRRPERSNTGTDPAAIMDGDDVAARLEAIERALADGDADLTGIGEAAERERELDELRDRLDDLESEVTDLAASVQAVRGYVGNVRTVNREVERQADAALAKVEELERRGADRGDRRADGDADAPSQPARDEPRAEGRREEPTDSPGDIARRITGEDERDRGRRPPRDEGDRGRAGGRRDGADGRSRGGNGSASGKNEGDGLLAGLRDAL